MNGSEDGVEMLELAQSSVAQSAASVDSIGRIETSHGNVFITHTDGSKVKGEPGLEIFQGDTVDTDATGSVGIVFTDDSIFSLAEKGSMVIDSMIYDPGTQEGKSAFSVAEGVFTFVSGSIAKTGVDAMVINTPTATIGIRGTSLGGKVADGKGSTITLLPDGGTAKTGGDAAGDQGALKGQQGNDGLGPAGEVTISNSVGTQTISKPYQTTQVSSQFSSPTLPVTLPASVVNQAYASAISAAPAPRGASAAPTGSGSSGNAGGGNTGGGEQPAAPGTEAAATAADGTGDGTAADAAVAAEGAATNAFNDAIAGGASLDDAMAAATTAAVETTVQAVLAANPEAFGTAASISSIVGAVVNAAMGGLGSSAGDPLDAGKGSDNAVSNQAAQAATQSGTLAAIAGQAQAAAQAAVLTNAVALVQSGLMSQGALSELAANLNAGQPVGGTLGGGLGGAIDVASFGAVFANVLATVVTVVAATIDDVIAAITPAGETTVTTDVVGTASHDLIVNQNDVFTGSAGNDTLTLSNAAQAGDAFDGSGGSDTLTLATAGVGHVFKISNTEYVNLPSVGAGNSALLNIVGAGTTWISGSATGTTAVAGDSSDQVLTFNSVFDGSTNSLSLTGGGGTDKVTFANGTNVIAAMVGIESVELGSSSTTFNSSLSGVEFSSSAATANITLAGVGNSISIASGGGIGTVTGSSGTDALSFTGTSSISSLSGFETVTATSASANFTLAAGGQSTTVSGTFGSITGGSGNDTVTFGSSGATISSISGVETIVGGSGNDTVTLGTVQTSGSINLNGGTGNDTVTLGTVKTSGVVDLNGGTDTLVLFNDNNSFTVSDTETITGGTGNDAITLGSLQSSGTVIDLNGGSDSLTLANGANTLSVSDVELITGGSGNDSITLGTVQTSGTTIDLNGGTDTLILANGANTLSIADVETITGGTGTDTIALADGGQTVSGISAVETVTGGSGNDTVTYTAAQTSGVVDLNGGTDTLVLANANNSFTVSDTETITGGTGNDTVTLGTAQTSGTVDLNGGTDTLVLFNDNNSFTVSDTETITGGSGNDTITLGSTQVSGTVIDLNGGTDSLTLAAGGNTLTVTNVETLVGGSGDDTVTFTGSNAGTLTLGGGADHITISGATGVQTIVYSATSDYGDDITGFTAGSGGDVIKVNVAMSRGTNADFEALATGGTVGANTAVVNYTTNITNYGAAADVATAMNTLTGLAAGNQMLFAVGNGTHSRLWHWQDGTGGGSSDGTVEAEELAAVVDLSSVSHTTLTAANFSGYTGTDPLVFDLDGDGVELLGTDAGVLFDVNGDGLGDSVGWVGPDDGLLVYDRNGDGLITGMDEVVSPEFGPSAAAGISSNSLDALALLDGNADGVIDAADDIYGMLQLWRDANTDGITDTGELMSLSDLGIESISLAGSGVTIDNAGNSITRTSSFTYNDGSTGEVAEVTLAQGGSRFIFESTNTSLSLSDFSGQTSFLGAAGNDDTLVLDTSSLGISSIAYEEITWDGTTGAINLSNTAANVVILTGAAGTQDAAAAALAAGNASGSNAIFLLRDSANIDKLTVVHTDDVANDGTESAIGVFDSQTTDVGANLDATDFAIVA